MARTLNTLTANQIKSARYENKGFKLFDGGGLFLHVQSGAKYWRLKYRAAGKEKLLALGVYPETSLADARRGRDQAKALLASGIDPSAHKKATKRARVTSAANTFKLVALEWWESVHRYKVVESHAKNNLRRLELYVFPALGNRPISDITPGELLEVLKPIQNKEKIETAHRVKSLCGQIFRYGIPSGRTKSDITRDLKDALRPSETKHLPAITNPKEAGKLLRAIDNYEGHVSTSNALKLAPLLFVRPGELRTVLWEDFDLDKGEWDYQPSKGGLPFISPLADQAVVILKEQLQHTGESRYVFPSIRSQHRPMSNNTLTAALQRLDFKGKMTAHGFRAMARTMLAEQLNYPIEYIEQQLAHTVRDSNGRAYNRTTYLVQRREMMQSWADYLCDLKAE